MWDEIFLLACKCRHIFSCCFSPCKKVKLLQAVYLQAPGFSFSSKTTMFSKFQFGQGCGRKRTTIWMYTVQSCTTFIDVCFILNQSIILTLLFRHVNTGYHYIYHNFGNFLVELLLTNIYSEG